MNGGLSEYPQTRHEKYISGSTSLHADPCRSLFLKRLSKKAGESEKMSLIVDFRGSGRFPKPASGFRLQADFGHVVYVSHVY